MTAGTIAQNGAGLDSGTYKGSGGGVGLYDGEFEMSGGEIKDNHANVGGGVYFKEGSFTMRSSAVITPSTGIQANTPGENDAYLANGKTITVGGALSPVGGTAARITPETYAPTTPRVLDGPAVGSGHAKFTVTPRGSDQWRVGSDGKLQTP